MSMSTSEQQWRIGAVARATGLTVRTLHHYDEIGLLVPSGRTESGYRLYGDADVRRLYRIRALRAMGFALNDIAAALAHGGADPRDVVRRQLARLDEQTRLADQLRLRLMGVLDALDRVQEPSGDTFIEIIEVMTRMEQYYTPEQLAELEQRAADLGHDGMQKAQQDWADLIADFEAEQAAGTDPADPKVQALADRYQALIEAFTGGSPEIRASLQRLYDTEGAAKASHGMVKPALQQYMQNALAAR